MTRKSALVVCPGRGTYNREELGYLGKHHPDKAALIKRFDMQRGAQGQEAVSELDGAEKFSVSRFTCSDNASPLIYACAYADYLSIDRDRYEVVAITGNSMGWYIALVCAGVLDADNGFDVVNTMGALMQEGMRGGQFVYPVVDENWVEIDGKRAELTALVNSIPGLYVSIDLGGVLVLAGETSALEQAEGALEPLQGRFPMRLANHSAFHTPLLSSIAMEAQGRLTVDRFRQPVVPLVDGRGHTWLRQGSNLDELWTYTFDHQVTQTYDFARAVRNSIREFAPDSVIVLGPGETLGGAVAQSLIEEQWCGLTSKEAFVERQKEAPVLLAMGSKTQRCKVVSTSDKGISVGNADV